MYDTIQQPYTKFLSESYRFLLGSYHVELCLINTLLTHLVLRAFENSGLCQALATDISRDGALSGPATDLYSKLVEDWPGIKWQASGGVAQLSDLPSLRQSGVDGVIIGKALFEKRFTLAEAFQCLRAV